MYEQNFFMFKHKKNTESEQDKEFDEFENKKYSMMIKLSKKMRMNERKYESSTFTL